MHCMLQRASAEQKALTYKKEGACFIAAVYIHPECVLQSVSCFRQNGCLSPWEGASVSIVGLSVNSAWCWGSSHFLAQIQKDKKHPQLFLIHLFLERKRWSSFLPCSRGSFFSTVGQSWRRWVYLGKASFASGLLRGLIQPLFHRDLWVAVSSSRHRGDPFAALHESPFIHEDLRMCSGSVSSIPASPSHALLV